MTVLPVPGTQHTVRRRTVSRLCRRWAFGLLVAVIAVWSLFPFAWQVITSFEPDRDLARFTPTWLPVPGGTLQHYRNVFVAKTGIGQEFLERFERNIEQQESSSRRGTPRERGILLQHG